MAFALVAGAAFGLWRAKAVLGPQSPVELHYTVRITDPAAARLEVQLDIAGARRNRLHLGFSPNAVASSVPVGKFRILEAVRASGAPLGIEGAPGDWTLRGVTEHASLHYAVHLSAGRTGGEFADEVLSHLDGGGGRLLGSDVFLFPLDAPAASITVDYELPPGWDLHHPFATGPKSGAPPSLHALYASAVAVGPYRTVSRHVGGCDLVLAVRGNFAFGDDDIMRMIERIARHQLEFFGQAPQNRFVFIVNPHPHADDPQRLHYFGLHFQASMILLIDPRTDRVRLQAEPASLTAHEFFHTWLGEQLRQENYGMNWFVEGVTSLYADRTRVATRMLDRGRHAAELRERYTDDYEPSVVRMQMSVAEAGQQVLQNQAMTRLLYSGGTLLAVSLEDEIRVRSQATASLDDLVRRMVDRAASDPSYRLNRESLERELLALTGTDFSDWLDRYVYGTETMPLPGYVVGR